MFYIITNIFISYHLLIFYKKSKPYNPINIYYYKPFQSNHYLLKILQTLLIYTITTILILFYIISIIIVNITILLHKPYNPINIYMFRAFPPFMHLSELLLLSQAFQSFYSYIIYLQLSSEAIDFTILLELFNLMLTIIILLFFCYGLHNNYYVIVYIFLNYVNLSFWLVLSFWLDCTC